MLRLSATALSLMLATVAATPALGTARNVTLSVPAMNCPSCPATLRTVLDRLPGVHVVQTDLQHRTLRVQITDASVTNQQLFDATKSAGYPSTLVASEKS